jgi:hypothetical protein
MKHIITSPSSCKVLRDKYSLPTFAAAMSQYAHKGITFPKQEACPPQPHYMNVIQYPLAATKNTLHAT